MQALFTLKLNQFRNFFLTAEIICRWKKRASKCVDLLQFGCKSNYFGERKKLIFLFQKIVRKLLPIKRCWNFLGFFLNRIANKSQWEKRNNRLFYYRPDGHNILPSYDIKVSTNQCNRKSKPKHIETLL